MERLEEGIGLARRLADRLFPLTLAIGFLITVGLPTTYFLLGSDALRQSATIHAQHLSERLRGLVLEAPALWKYQTHKYEQILREFVPYKEVTIIRVLDEAGRPIIAYEHKTAEAGAWWNRLAPVSSVPLVFEDRQVGTVQVGVSQSALLRATLALLLLSTATGASLAFWIYRFPVRVVSRMEEEQERLRAVAAASERRFGDLVQDVDAVVWEADAATWQFSFVSRHAEALLGYPVERWLKEPTFWADHIHPDDRERAVTFCRAATSEGRDHQFEYRALTADGQAVWIRDIVRLVRDPDGSVRRLRGVMVDITALKEAEEVLAERTRRLEAVGAVTEEITRELHLSTVLGLISQRAVELSGAASGVVYLWDEAGQVLVPRAWHGLGEWMEEVRLKPGEGITGTVARRREGMIVNDYRTSPLASPLFLERTGITAALAEPLLYRDRLLGVITLNNEGSERPFTGRDREVLTLFADQASIAIENARLHEMALHRTRQMATLNDLLRRLTTVLDPQLVGREILTAVQTLFPGAAVRLWGRTPDEHALRLAASLGVREPEGGVALTFRPGEGLTGIAVATRQPVTSRDVTQDPRFVNKAWAVAEGLVSGIIVPLVYGDRVTGTLAIFTRAPHDFSEEEVDLLRSFAAQAAIAIENARLLDERETARRVLERLHAVGISLHASREIGDRLENFLRGVHGVVGFDRLNVLLVTPDRSGLEVVVSAEEGVVPPRIRIPLDSAGPFAEVLRTGRALLIQGKEDLETFPRFDRALSSLPLFRSTHFVIVPLLAGDQVIGVVSADNKRSRRPITTASVEQLQLFCQQLAVAIDNAHLLADEQERRREAAALLEMARATAATLEEKELLKLIARGAARACSVDRCSIFLWDESRGRVIPVMSQFADGTADPRMWEAFKRLGDLRIEAVPFFLEVVRRREPLLITDPGSDPLIPPGWSDLFQIKASLDVPLIYQDRALGVLVLDYVRETRPFTPEQVRLAMTLAGQVTLAMENARLVKDLRQALDDLKAAQDQLVRGATLRAVGELASGMAHHLNNLLAIVLGRIDLLLQRVREPEVRRSLESAARAARDGAEVVRRLRGFSLVQPVSERVLVDLNQIASEVLELLRPLWESQAQIRGIQIQASLETGQIPAVSGEPATLREVVINLLLNAIDALPEGGRITVKTWASDQGVYCSVTDTGVGMSEEVRRRVLEPFFTTKGPKSTGLGLSVSYGIIQRHGGELAIESAPERGTTVTVRLPLVQAASAT